MKTTGVVRRIDELGRIVIPKEIRKNLRINEGENIEIYVDEDNVVLKKFSVLNKINEYADKIVDSVNFFIKKNIIITDNDKVIAASGKLKNEFLDKQISKTLIDYIKNRKTIIESKDSKLNLVDDLSVDTAYCLTNIIVEGDSAGLIIILSSDIKVDSFDMIICQMMARFLSKILED